MKGPNRGWLNWGLYKMKGPLSNKRSKNIDFTRVCIWDWAILTAMRGPDYGESKLQWSTATNVKEITTCVIRHYAMEKPQGYCGIPNNSILDAQRMWRSINTSPTSRNAAINFLRNNKHFINHINDAITALKIKYPKYERELTEYSDWLNETIKNTKLEDDI